MSATSIETVDLNPQVAMKRCTRWTFPPRRDQTWALDTVSIRVSSNYLGRETIQVFTQMLWRQFPTMVVWASKKSKRIQGTPQKTLEFFENSGLYRNNLQMEIKNILHIKIDTTYKTHDSSNEYWLCIFLLRGGSISKTAQAISVTFRPR